MPKTKDDLGLVLTGGAVRGAQAQRPAAEGREGDPLHQSPDQPRRGAAHGRRRAAIRSSSPRPCCTTRSRTPRRRTTSCGACSAPRWRTSSIEVTDVKFLAKESRKRLQVAKAGRASERARQVKLADKICNLRDILASPPAGWSLARRQKYFDWAKEVVDQARGVNPKLERMFDRLYRQRPVNEGGRSGG